MHASNINILSEFADMYPHNNNSNKIRIKACSWITVIVYRVRMQYKMLVRAIFSMHVLNSSVGKKPKTSQSLNTQKERIFMLQQ